jgi:hypothetical protein
MAAISAIPPGAHTMSRLPIRDIGSNGVDDASYFVAGNPGILDAREESLLRDAVAVANTASLNLDSNLSTAGFRNLALYKFKRSIGLAHLYRTHFSHVIRTSK